LEYLLGVYCALMMCYLGSCGSVYCSTGRDAVPSQCLLVVMVSVSMSLG
jgi:hypothetical protein